MKVLSFGSLNIDYVYHVPHLACKGETLASESLQRFSGGKGLNQSIALARAGLEVYHAGAIGSDGTFLVEELRAAGVDTTYVICLSDVRTGHAIIQRDGNGDNCILLYGGANRAVTREQIDRTLASFSSHDLLVVQNEISELDYLINQAKKRGMTVALNPSPMEESLAEPALLADYLLLNEVEAAQMLGCAADSDSGQMIRELHAAYPNATIVLTLGERGSIYLAGERTLRQEAVKAETVDTTAAGDTFTGYFLSGILGGHDAAWALRYASVAASIAVSRQGAAPSIPERYEVLGRM